MSTERLPLLAEDETRLDWTKARYSADIQRTGRESRVTVIHVLKDAVALASAVRSGDAVWVTEVRCPRLLFSEHVRSADERQVVEWSEEVVEWERAFLLPGLAASRKMTLNAVDGLDPVAWPRDAHIDVPDGALLARADVRRLKPLMHSLLVFHKDESLQSGEMLVEELSSTDDPCFKVRLAPDVFEESLRNRDRRIAALIGAFAAMAQKGSRMQADGELSSHPVTKELQRRLIDAGISTWDDEDFDCARAATFLEPFWSTEPINGDEDDE